MTSSSEVSSTSSRTSGGKVARMVAKSISPAARPAAAVPPACPCAQQTVCLRHHYQWQSNIAGVAKAGLSYDSEVTGYSSLESQPVVLKDITNQVTLDPGGTTTHNDC